MKYMLLIFSLLLLLTACDTVWDEPFVPDTDIPDSEGFYQVQSGNFTLKYKRGTADDLICRLSGTGTGWLAVGFDPSSQMRDANFIIGYVSGANAFIRDDFGVDNTTHEADTAIGGTSDVTLISSSEAQGTTTLEFSIPLNSGDTKDKVLSVGSTYNVIFATGSDDDYDSYHTGIASGSIKIR